MADRGLTGILLVGGGSTRFGSPKAFAEIDGVTLAVLAWDRLAFCAERIAVGKTADLLDLPFPILDDGTHVRAPIAGVVAGIRAAANDVSIMLPVDTPNVTAEALAVLAAACRDAAVPQSGPLPGAYRKSALPVLEAALSAGRLSLREAIAGLDVAQVEVDPALLTNINTPDDL